jgi:hypothetical protein
MGGINILRIKWLKETPQLNNGGDGAPMGGKNWINLK